MSYVAWQFFYGPRWLLQFSWTLQRALARFFSVSLMFKTLFAHWRRDVVSYRGGLGQLFQIFLLNQVSRGIGFIIRSSLLLTWLITALLLIPFSITIVALFVLWPFMALGFVVIGFIILSNGGL